MGKLSSAATRASLASTMPAVDDAAIGWAWFSLSARFCVWPIIGTRNTLEPAEEEDLEAVLFRCAATSDAARSVTTGNGRKHGPTLFETHNERSAAITERPRKSKRLDLVLCNAMEILK